MRRERLGIFGAALAALACFAAWPAAAADFYLTGRLSIANTTGDFSGRTDFFRIRGTDTDTSPVYGGALGFAFRPSEPFPRIGTWRVPDFRLRTDLEGLTGHSYELRAAGGDGFFNEIDAWTFMQNFWVDVPIHSAVSWLFGRIPILEPVSVYAGGGVGMTELDFFSTDNVSAGAESKFGFAWQTGAGLNYDFTDIFSLTLGYRYQDLGDVEATLSTGPGAGPFGRVAAELTSHEFTTGLRINFYSLGLPRVGR